MTYSLKNNKTDFSYASLDSAFFADVAIQPMSHFALTHFNHALFTDLTGEAAPEDAASWLSDMLGVDRSSEAPFLAMAYAGHQFGHFTMLGDGRACLAAELQSPSGEVFDLHIKGSGPTPYARQGDGHATLGPMAREYLISEAMHALGIPSTRSLALFTTGNQVFRDEWLDGAMLLRVASSHIRVGTFEYAAMLEDTALLNAFFRYAALRHYPQVLEDDNPALAFLTLVMQKQIELVCHWLRVGFIHGVMNTDNTTVSGETIDYGPCAFMDEYHAQKVFSSIDRQGRYAFANQPHIIFWNLTRLAESLLPLIDSHEQKAIDKAQATLEQGQTLFQQQFFNMMVKKIGFEVVDEASQNLVHELLALMESANLDYTNTFLQLGQSLMDEHVSLPKSLLPWVSSWQQKLNADKRVALATALMAQANPQVIPRNHLVEQALHALTNNHCDKTFKALLQRLKAPYEHQDNDSEFQTPPKDEEKVMATFCGT